ncbi:hypothetical protein CIW49_04030 [Mycolicibacterium sp. P1-18]|uniref:hypothetical protein n=1 Tax=Mycolicibacterium sp. P1-18 TaxID=2024615 RepID=UPI0011F3D43B|nr:hypothetical protein [Mycolicibacterium sp. P1-18]KAA0100738.1 hypothetical protein CIW49_04030 [Mycolicibacterium sp. P1-18]
MVTSTMRLAAGVAVAVAITVAGGPSVAVAVADPGYAGPSSHSRDGGHSRGERHYPRRPVRDRGPRGDDRPDRPGSRPGGQVTPGLVSAPLAPTPATSGGGVSIAAPAAQIVVPVSPPTARTGRGGVGPVRPAATRPTPRVVVGNGRPPAPVRVPVDAAAPPVPPRAIVAVPPPVAPIAVTVAAPAPMTVRTAPAPRLHLPAPRPWEAVRPGWPTGTIFGIAGLLLAPIAGMWLGHRQARASKSASQLVSR